MAIFSIEIADSDVERVINAICTNYNRPEMVVDQQNPNSVIPNPEDKYVFANRMVREFLSDHVKKYEVDLAKKKLEELLNSPPNINDPQT